jgi:hypothetical protein
MLKSLKEPYLDYKLILTTSTPKISVEWYVSESNVLSFSGARLDGRFASTNWTLEQALERLPNCDVLKQMINIKNHYQDKEVPQNILTIIDSWYKNHPCKRVQR